jgi:mono/diheme cytochrome c family protein
MGRLWRPVLIGAVVVVATFLLAQATIFEPEAEQPQAPLTGDAERGAVVFESTCSGCHGPGGEGGTGPRLINTGLDAATVAITIVQGAGVMPGGLVSGQEQADVTAYVASISN